MNSSTNFVLQLLSLSSSTAIALTMAVTAPAQAKPHTPSQSGAKPTSIETAASCDTPLSVEVDGFAGKSVAEESILNFSAAESDAAVLLFKCDCINCINALRQLRSQPLLASGQGHCSAGLSTNYSQQMIDQVLEAVETAEANGPDTPLSWDRPKSATN
ncbi:MAG: hypothetical protein QNJ46_14430 [Leptolyngbyaceae cyanobacterium MO_188.B28]|nr:hypothetical protein [Leptolyngbyaceae cyanobacterium MO_188.B28]